MAKMNWNRPNNGYEREPWDKPRSSISFRTKVQKKINRYGYVMTDELRNKIQALRKKQCQ
jgi:hypothetical protein